MNPNSPLLTPQDLIQNYLQHYFEARMYAKTSPQTGHIRGTQIPVLAAEFTRYTQSLILENSLLDGKALYYYYRLGDYYFKIIAKQDPSKSYPYFIADSFEELPELDSETSYDNTYYMFIHPKQLLDNAKHIAALPKNIASIYLMMLDSYFYKVFGS